MRFAADGVLCRVYVINVVLCTKAPPHLQLAPCCMVATCNGASVSARGSPRGPLPSSPRGPDLHSIPSLPMAIPERYLGTPGVGHTRVETGASGSTRAGHQGLCPSAHISSSLACGLSPVGSAARYPPRFHNSSVGSCCPGSSLICTTTAIHCETVIDNHNLASRSLQAATMVLRGSTRSRSCCSSSQARL